MIQGVQWFFDRFLKGFLTFLKAKPTQDDDVHPTSRKRSHSFKIRPGETTTWHFLENEEDMVMFIKDQMKKHRSATCVPTTPGTICQLEPCIPRSFAEARSKHYATTSTSRRKSAQQVQRPVSAAALQSLPKQVSQPWNLPDDSRVAFEHRQLEQEMDYLYGEPW